MVTIFGDVNFYFQELFLKTNLQRKEIEVKGITGKPGKIISSNGMTKHLNKEQRGVIT